MSYEVLPKIPEGMTCPVTGCLLANEQVLEDVAERAAQKAIAHMTEHIYREVGKSVLSKLLYLVGACIVGLYLWLHSKGVWR